jgi:hypothetical protein
MRAFPETAWSSVYALAEATAEAKQALLSRFFLKYQPCLIAYLQGPPLRLTELEAEEIAQGFITDKILANQLLERASSHRGRLRSLLRVALKRYALNCLRAKRGETFDPYQHNPPYEIQAVDLFDVQWALSLFQRSLALTRRYCETDGRKVTWRVFDARVVGPLFGREEVAYEQLCHELNAEPEFLHAQLQFAKRRFGAALREITSEYTHSEEEADEEVRELIRVIREAPADVIELKYDPV